MSKLGEQIRAKTSTERTRIEVAEWGDDEPLVFICWRTIAVSSINCKKSIQTF